MRRRAAITYCGAVFAALATLSCGERITGVRGDATLAVVPVFSESASAVFGDLAAFDLAVENVRIRLSRSGGAVAVDSVIAFPVGVDSLEVELSLPIVGSQESLQALIELRQGETVLFSGERSVQASVTRLVAAEIPVEYSGPGATATTLSVAPVDTAVRLGTTGQFRATARDVNQQELTNLIIAWTVADVAVGTIGANGLFTAGTNRDSTYVFARLPTGLVDSTRVFVVPAPTHLVVVSGGDQTGTVGQQLPAPIVVELRALDGLPVRGVEVTFTATVGGGSVSSAAVTTNANGQANATFTLGTTAGLNTLEATSAGVTPVTVNATGVAGAATAMALLQQPESTVVAGLPMDVPPAVQLRDANGNNTPFANFSITAVVEGGSGQTAGGTTSALTDANGLATFPGLSVDGLIGVVQIRFESTGLPSVTSANVTVVAGAADTLVFTVQPISVDVDELFGVSVTALDAFGNLAADFIDSVTIAIQDNPGSGVLAGVTTVASNAGVASFAGLSINAAGVGYTLSATSGLLPPVGSNAFTVLPPPAPPGPSQLALVQPPPATAISGAILTPHPTVQLRDSLGNDVAQAEVMVTAQLLGGDGQTLGGTVGVLTDAMGLATFNNLSIGGPSGTVQLSFTAEGLTSAQSGNIVVTFEAATQLAFTTQPGDVIATGLFTVAVEARDGQNNPVPTYTGNVTIAIQTNPASGTLSGTLTVAAVSGVATFNGLSINQAGNGYTLGATSGALAAATSNAFNVLDAGTTYHDVRRAGDIAIYKNYNAWLLDEKKEETTLQDTPFKLVPLLGDYSVRPMSDLSAGIPTQTSLAIITSASNGNLNGQITQQVAGFTELDAWVRAGGWLVVHAGDNADGTGYQVPGLTGIADDVQNCSGLSPAVANHAFIRGPDAALGTGDDITDAGLDHDGKPSNCNENHGSLDGVLPGNAEVLVIEEGGLQRPVYATYTLGAGRVIVTTMTMEFYGQPTQTMINHLYWAIYGLNAPAANPQPRVVSWASPTDGNWSDGANWDLGVPPASDDTVRIALPGTYTVTVDNNRQVAVLEVGAASGTQTLQLTSSTLAVASSASFAAGTGRLVIGGGTLAGSGTVTIGGELYWTSGTMTGTGVTRIAAGATATLDSNFKNLIGGRGFEVAGTAIGAGSGIAFGGGSTLYIEPGGVFDLREGLTLSTTTGGGTITNAGTFTRSGGTGVTSVAVGFINNGAVDVQTGALHFASFAGPFTHTGTFAVAAGAQLGFANSTNTVTGAISGAGVLRGISGTTTVSTATTVGALVSEGGFLSVNGPATVSDSLHIGFGTLTLSGGTTVAVPILTQLGGSLLGADTVVVLDSLLWHGGTMGGTGLTRVDSMARAALVATGTKTLLRGFDLEGQMQWSAGAINASGGPFFVRAGAVVELLFDANLNGSGQLFNHGRIVKTGGVGVSTMSPSLFNAGRMDVESGILRVAGTGIEPHTGTFTAAAGTTFEFITGTHTLDSTVTGLGSARVAGATVVANGTVDVSRLVVANGSLTVNGPITVTDTLVSTGGTLSLESGSAVAVPLVLLSGGAIQGSDTLVVLDSLHWTSGSMAGLGVSVLPDTATAHFTTTGSKLLSARTLLLDGTVNWDAGAFSFGNAGALVVRPTGALNILDNVSTSVATGSGTITNQGSITKSGGTGASNINIPFTNAASFGVNVGTVRLFAAGTNTHTGVFTVAAGATLETQSGTQVFEGSVSGSGAFTVNGALTTANGGVSMPTVLISSGSLTTGGALTVGQELRVTGGTLTLSSGGQVAVPVLVQSIGTVQGVDTLVVLDSLHWTSGTQGGTGVTRTLDTTQVVLATIGNKTLNGGRRFELGGPALWNGGQITLAGGSPFDVLAGATLDVQGDFTMSAGTGSGTLNIHGLLTRTSGAGILALNVPVVNLGNLVAATGTLRLAGAGGPHVHTGLFTVDAPAVLEFAGGTHQVDSAIVGNGSGRFASTLTTLNGSSSLSALIASSGAVVVNGPFALTDSLRILFGNITLSSGGQVTVPVLVQTGGTLQGADTVVVLDSLHWAAGIMGGTGLTRVVDSAHALITTTATKTLSGGRKFELAGTLDWAAGTFSFAGGSPFDILAGAEVRIVGNMSASGIGTINNLGRLMRTAGTGAATISVPFVNTGQVEAHTGELQFTAGVGPHVYTGPFFVSAPGQLMFTGTGTHVVDSTITGTGLFSSSASLTTLNGSYGLPALTVFGGFTTVNGPLTALTDSLRVTAGTLTLATGDVVAVPLVVQMAGTLQGSDTLVVLDSLLWAGGIMGGTGMTRVVDTARVAMAGTSAKTLSGGRAFDLAGSLRWTGGSLTFVGGSPFTILPTGFFEVLGNMTMNVGTGSGSLTNQGIFARVEGTGATIIGVPFVNNAELQTLDGTLRFSAAGGPYVHTGTFFTAAPSVLEFSNGNHQMNSGVTGSGRALFSGATATLNGTFNHPSLAVTAGSVTPVGPFTVVDSLRVAGGTLTLSNAGNFTVPALVLTAGTLTGTDTVIVTDSMRWSGGTMSGEGGFTRIANTAVAEITTTTSKNLSRSLTVDGILRWLAGSLFMAGTIEFLISPTGVLDLQGTLALNDPNQLAELVIEGLMTKTAGTGIATIAPRQRNLGAVEVSAGTLRLFGSGTQTHSGTFVSTAPGVLEFAGGVHMVNSTVTGTGQVFFGGSTTTLNGTFSVPSVAITGGTLNIASPFQVADSLRMTGGTLNVDTAVVISSGSRFELRNNVNVGGTGSLTNQGRFGKTAGTGTSTVSIPFANASELVAGTGTLAFSNTFAHQASALMSGNATFNLGGASISAFDGNVAPGASPGTLTIAGPISQSAASTLLIELGGLTVGTQYDRLVVTGTASSFVGNLTVTLINGLTPASGNSFTILTYPVGSTVSFGTVTLPTGMVLDDATTPGSILVRMP